jgi:putative drug exporter of the RND superfamily
LDTQIHLIQADTDELRDHIADFDDLWRPIRSYFYWERHCFDIPICWSLRSLFDSLDGVDKLSGDLGDTAKDIDKVDAILPELDAQLPPLIATLRTVRGLTMTLTSTFSGLINQTDAFSQNATAMGQAFDAPETTTRFTCRPKRFRTRTSSGV